MKFSERIWEAIREVCGILLSLLEIICEAYRGILLAWFKAKNIIDFWSSKRDVLSTFFPADHVPIDVLNLILREKPLIILKFNVFEILLSLKLAADTNFHAELVQRFLFGDIHDIEAYFMHFGDRFDPEKEPLIMAIRIRIHSHV